MTAKNPLTWDKLHLFASDEDIGEAALGYDRRKEFACLAALHERNGMPKISPVWGGRYVPAVKAFLDAEYGLTAVPLAANGVEGSFHATKQRRAPEKSGLEMATPPERPSGPVLVR
jgi:hypothetical protein